MGKIKVCPKCKIRERQQYRSKKYLCYCKECYKVYRHQYRTLHKEQDRIYWQKPERKKKQAIRDYLKDRFRYGKIKKEKCLLCDSKEKLEFHHPDYNKPHEYIVLCKNCHQQEHNKHRGND